MKLFDFFKFKKPEHHDLDFIDVSKFAFANHPIKLASEVPTTIQTHRESTNQKYTLPICPGMWDYSRIGYIVPCWTDYHIKVNRAGSVVIMGGNEKTAPFTKPMKMEYNIIDGLVKYEEGIPRDPWNFFSPWKVYSYSPNISALIMPAFFHMSQEIFKNTYVVPGIVDYDKFHSMNFICAFTKKCEFTIPAGEPLLHVIPIVNKPVVCGYGPPNAKQESELNYDPKVHQRNFYRKNFQFKKLFSLNKKEE